MSTHTRTFYARWARLYHVLATLPGVRAWRERAVDALDLGATDTVVDVGCGTGANLRYLSHRVGPDGRVVGLDVTRRSLAIARDHADAAVVQGDATQPPLSGPIDGLLGTFVVGMFADPAGAVDEWCDLVRPGGRIALLHFHRSPRWWARLPNLAYRAFVWLSSPDKLAGAAASDDSAGRDSVAAHDTKVRQAHRALAARTTDYRGRELAGGFVRLESGTVPE